MYSGQGNKGTLKQDVTALTLMFGEEPGSAEMFQCFRQSRGDHQGRISQVMWT